MDSNLLDVKPTITLRLPLKAGNLQGCKVACGLKACGLNLQTVSDIRNTLSFILPKGRRDGVNNRREGYLAAPGRIPPRNGGDSRLHCTDRTTCHEMPKHFDANAFQTSGASLATLRVTYRVRRGKIEQIFPLAFYKEQHVQLRGGDQRPRACL
jgi:hypothetical protein